MITIIFLSEVHVVREHFLDLLEVKPPGSTEPQEKSIGEPGIRCERVAIEPFLEQPEHFRLALR